MVYLRRSHGPVDLRLVKGEPEKDVKILFPFCSDRDTPSQPFMSGRPRHQTNNRVKDKIKTFPNKALPWCDLQVNARSLRFLRLPYK